MKAMLALEQFGYGTRKWSELWAAIGDMAGSQLGTITFGMGPGNAWVAEITGINGHNGFERKFLKGKVDFSLANSKCSRGVMIRYILDSDHIYEVKEQLSWSRCRRYFCEVNANGEIVEITEKDVVSRITFTDGGRTHEMVHGHGGW